MVRSGSCDSPMKPFLIPMLCVACTPSKSTDTASPHPAEERSFYLVSETSTGKMLVASNEHGRVEGELCLSDIFPEQCGAGTSELARPCLMFGVSHQRSDDDDRFLITATLRDPDRPFAPGIVSLVRPSDPPEALWSIRNLTIPRELQSGFDCEVDGEAPQCHLYGAHTTISLDDGTLIVSDTSNSRVVWIETPDLGAETGNVVAILSSQHPQWGDERYPNLVQPLTIDERDHLLITFKGGVDHSSSPTNEGRIALWDVSDRSLPERVWVFPEVGHLSAVHSGRFVETPAGDMLIYAHSLGASEGGTEHREGTIGFAQFNGLEPPKYLADGTLPDPGFGFTREVEWNGDIQRLIVTDSGCENAQDSCGRSGRVIALSLPELNQSDRGGSAQPDLSDQDFIELDWKRTVIDQALELPFDTNRIPFSEAGAQLREGLGPCHSP